MTFEETLLEAALRPTVDNAPERIFIGKLLKLLRKPERLSTREYAEKYRWLGADVTSRPGKMNCMETPFMLYPMECMDNFDVKVIVAMKSAQIAWSETTNSYLSKRMHLDPQNIIIAFPRMESAKKYSREKIRPMIKSNPALLEDIGNPDRCSYKFYKFNGGWLSLVTARSTEDLKSSSVPIILVEEPDGLQDDIGNQGDALDLLMQRQKTYEERKLIYGGTPTDADFSRVDSAYKQSNQMVYMVPCRTCGEFHELCFSNLKCDVYQDRKMHSTYRERNPETAYYECPHCKAVWDDADRKQAVLEALNYHNMGWKALRPEETDIYGFAFCELMSSFAASTHAELMKKKIKAEVALEAGFEGLMKSFTNNSMGKAYASKATNLNVEELRQRRINYPEGVVPLGGIVLTMGIDVQHNRFAFVVRAWGKNNCSWLVLWKEIFGKVTEPDDPVWAKLTATVLGTFPHQIKDKNGVPFPVHIEAASIDCSDGNTSELVYAWVKSMYEIAPTLPIFATKGSTDTNFNAEIFSEPPKIESNTLQQARESLASRMGVNVFMLGAHKAHEEILRRINLTGVRDRYYHNETSYGRYEEQILSCAKRISSGEITRYELKPGQRKEAIDCEKLALHASYAIQLRSWTDEHWTNAEKSIIGLG